MNSLQQLSAGELAGARRIKLCCGLQSFPREIFTLADTLEVLDLSGNAFAELPADLPRLGKLRILFCSNNRFTELPAVLGQCAELEMVGFKANQIRRIAAGALPARLRWLILTDNELEELPPAIGDCTRLQKLMLAGNRLSSLPPEMAACTALELLRIAANRLSRIPEWLLTLPRLAWLAFAGNPFCAGREAAALTTAQVTLVPWDRLNLLHVLGEGASGVIHRADLARVTGATGVAVKLFKGSVTSDGLPLCEMTASLSAGEHPNLIPVMGQISAHPAAAAGLVMSLVDSDFRNLAGPPSFESCTRDVYAADATFTPDAAVDVALGIASVICHLHARGILHGDLYAHNILHSGTGRVLLGDFGAASLFAPEDRQQADALQRLEVRAFACLLEELVARSDVPPPFHALKDACLHTDPQARPLFAEIKAALQDMLPSLTPHHAR